MVISIPGEFVQEIKKSKGVYAWVLGGGRGWEELEGGAGDLKLTFHIAFIPETPPPPPTSFINQRDPGTLKSSLFMPKDFFDNQLLFGSLMSFNSHKHNGAELKRGGNQILGMAISSFPFTKHLKKKM